MTDRLSMLPLRRPTVFSLMRNPVLSSQKDNGFTLLELIIVMFLISIILGISAVFFANTLPANRLNAVVREFSATVKQAKSLARVHGEKQTVTINLTAQQFGIEGREMKSLPPGIAIKISDTPAGEILQGTYQIGFLPLGGIEAGTITLSSEKRSVIISLDPVVGSVTIKQ